jgi:hypothetical protein
MQLRLCLRPDDPRIQLLLERCLRTQRILSGGDPAAVLKLIGAKRRSPDGHCSIRLEGKRPFAIPELPGFKKLQKSRSCIYK